MNSRSCLSLRSALKEYFFPVAFLILFLSAFLFPVISEAAPAAASQDNDYMLFSRKVSVLQPKYWIVEDYSRENAYGETLETTYLYDQADRGSRATKYIFAAHAIKSALFNLPVKLTDRLTESQLVNYYIYQSLRSSVDFKLIKAEAGKIDGTPGYIVTWSYLSPRGLAFGVTDVFVFKGNDVYQIHGEYAINLGGDQKTKIQRILDSVKILK